MLNLCKFIVKSFHAARVIMKRGKELQANYLPVSVIVDGLDTPSTIVASISIDFHNALRAFNFALASSDQHSVRRDCEDNATCTTLSLILRSLPFILELRSLSFIPANSKQVFMKASHTSSISVSAEQQVTLRA